MTEFLSVQEAFPHTHDDTKLGPLFAALQVPSVRTESLAPSEYQRSRSLHAPSSKGGEINPAQTRLSRTEKPFTQNEMLQSPSSGRVVLREARQNGMRVRSVSIVLPPQATDAAPSGRNRTEERREVPVSSRVSRGASEIRTDTTESQLGVDRVGIGVRALEALTQSLYASVGPQSETAEGSDPLGQNLRKLVELGAADLFGPNDLDQTANLTLGTDGRGRAENGVVPLFAALQLPSVRTESLAPSEAAKARSLAASSVHVLPASSGVTVSERVPRQHPSLSGPVTERAERTETIDVSPNAVPVSQTVLGTQSPAASLDPSSRQETERDEGTDRMLPPREANSPDIQGSPGWSVATLGPRVGSGGQASSSSSGSSRSRGAQRLFEQTQASQSEATVPHTHAKRPSASSSSRPPEMSRRPSGSRTSTSTTPKPSQLAASSGGTARRQASQKASSQLDRRSSSIRGVQRVGTGREVVQGRRASSRSDSGPKSVQAKKEQPQSRVAQHRRSSLRDVERRGSQ
eukprot:Cvel_22828.t3-p1 / transcript=Cvel_22828.t3 / gene=Cvel_22828 / organism=Chromera_velia_CCMP2878 / gene_product=hypothetical protein / transcript_product=hypothetical protein / location=Cvel_scaffold2286:18567-20120(-) / protein_length=518 / sequence_SO=supercontig / SO=protein_coding / is_pseudo=false